MNTTRPGAIQPLVRSFAARLNTTSPPACLRGGLLLALATLLALVLAAALAPALRAASVPVVLPENAASNERFAAQDLSDLLGRLYPNDRFPLATNLPAAGKAILLGRASDPLVRARLTGGLPAAPESFVVRSLRGGSLELGLIAGADARGTAFGVYQLLSRLGCGLTLSGDAIPAPTTNAFDFAGWNFADAPLFPERLVFNWHNFLSGCSTWNQADWERWTVQSQKMGYNAIMVHAYGNNPMAGFSFNQTAKPVGSLSTSIKGRDWSTMHVNNVRRLFGGSVFPCPVFGADAGMAPGNESVAAAQTLMRQVFARAQERGMGVYFAVDVDTPSANPAELIKLLPESARFQAKGVNSTTSGPSPERLWLPNPDTAEGYAFFRAQVDGLLTAYPQITTLVVWFRRDNTPWMYLTAADLPAQWQQEFAAELAKTPEAARLWRAPALFATAKILRAFDRALKERGASQTRLAAGTWGFEFLPAADRFFPAGVPLIGLDYDVIHERPQLAAAASRAPLRDIGARRPVIPVVWAHHDDAHYIGRPYTPLPELASKLADAGAAGFGIIHWTTRPLDLYFSSLAKQTWQSTKDQPLSETCLDLAERWHGPANRQIMGQYLQAWITGAPRFGRETTDAFIDRRLTNITQIVEGCRARIALLDQAQTAGLLPEQRERLDYQRGLEEFIAAFHETHGAFQESQDALKKHDLPGARLLMDRCHPEAVIEQFAKFSSLGGITRGEQGLVVSLNTRWLSHIIRHRQALGLEPVRIKFGPTSHDKLAQARGTFTFHFSTSKELWECWGQEETGAAIVTMPPLADLHSSGIEIAKPFTFTLRPILSGGSRPKPNTPPLPAGAWRVQLLLADPASTGPGQRVVDVKVAGNPVDRVDTYERDASVSHFIQLAYPVTLAAPGMVEVTLTPVKGQAILWWAMIEPVPNTGLQRSAQTPSPAIP